MCFYDDLLEGEQNLDHHVLKEDREAGDDSALFSMDPPVFTLMEDLNVCSAKEDVHGGDREESHGEARERRDTEERGEETHGGDRARRDTEERGREVTRRRGRRVTWRREGKRDTRRKGEETHEGERGGETQERGGGGAQRKGRGQTRM